VKVKLHRPQTPATKAASVLLAYLVVAAIALLLPLGGVPDVLAFVLVSVALIVASLVVYQLVWTTQWTRAGLIVIMVLTNYALVAASHDSALVRYGQRITVTVASVRTSHFRKTTTFHYRLVDVDSHQVPGELDQGYDRFRVGEHVTVIADPNGRIEPALPDEVTSALFWWLISGIGLVLTALGSVVAAYNRPLGPRPRRSELGFWHYRSR
jgi:hypothetical protein